MKPSAGQAWRYDLLIRGGEVIDGSGADRFPADVGIAGDRIAAVGDLAHAQAAHEIDARGRIVAPGFIDVHAHDDTAVFDPRLQWPKLSQGVTTVINGNCGLSAAPLVQDQVPAPLDLLGTGAFRFDSFGAYMQAVRQARPVVNAAFLVGHTTLRVGCVADLSRPATEGECARMRAQLQEALDAGALGASTGVFYPPARAATPQEVRAVCAPLAGTAGVLAAHIRDEGNHVMEALAEALDIGQALGVRCVISHHKVVGAANHGRTRETLGLLAARSRIQPLCLDCYPYDASSTMLVAERVDTVARVLITHSETHPQASGRDLDELAAQWSLDRQSAARRLMPGRAIYFGMDERDVQAVLGFAHTMVGSDGLALDPAPHPRLWGTFTRVLGRYSRDLGLFTLEQAVHKMTGLPASQFGLTDRGLVRAGLGADLTVFDPQAVADRATYARPMQASAGIHAVVINGAVAVAEGRPTAARPGRVLVRA